MHKKPRHSLAAQLPEGDEAAVYAGADVIQLPINVKCGRCEETDPSKFGKSKDRSNGLQVWCRKCFAAYAKERYQNPEIREKHAEVARKWRENRGKNAPSRTRAGRLSGQYGIDYESLWRAQEGKCAACHRPMTSDQSATGAVIDHDHRCCPGRRACGRCVRGLLHRSCNSALGLVLEDTAVLQGMIEYIKERT